MTDPRTGTFVHHFPSRIGTVRAPALRFAKLCRALALLLVLGPATNAGATEIDTEPQRHARPWILIVCRPGAACEERSWLNSLTACRLDAASEAVIVPAGTRLSCEKRMRVMR